MMDSDSFGNYVCRFCKGSFSQPLHLYKHVQQVHAANPSSKSSRTCPICGTVFAKYEGYRTHLRHIHGQRNEGQIFAFKCFNDFFLWKTELEKRSNCKFALLSAPKILPSQEKIHVYQCDQAVSSAKKKKSALAVFESCPAMICATESMKNREIKVEYWNTHSGHAVPAEEDELNAAISSVQPDQPEIHVMEILNNIEQGIETGAEISIAESVDEEMMYNSSLTPKVRQKNIFNLKKGKAAKVSSPNTEPIVQNFSFRKDPSKKKESSMYSLASVACGKVNANKVNISKPKEKADIIMKNPINREKTSILSFGKKKTDNSSNNKAFEAINSEQINNSVKQTAEKMLNSPDNFEPGESGSSNDILPSVENSSDKLLINKRTESCSVKVLPATTHKKPKSVLKQSNIKINELLNQTNKSTKPRDLSTTEASSKKISTSVQRESLLEAKPESPVFVLTNLPATQSVVVCSPSLITKSPHVSSIANNMNNVPSAAQTFISINNKLIPVMNNSGTVLSNLGSSVLLPSSIPRLSTQKPLISSLPSSTVIGTNTTGLVTPPLNSGVASNISPLLTLSDSSMLFIPVSNPSTISSPLVLQNSVPSQSIGGKSILSTSSVPGTPKPSNLTSLQTPVPSILLNNASNSLTVKNPEKPTLSTARKSVSSNTTSNSVKVQKVSLPTVPTSEKAESKSISISKQKLSLESSPTTMVLNHLPGITPPNKNFPYVLPMKNIGQKPGSLVFSSSGELYMLEPVDDDDMIKNKTPLTSTPKKVSIDSTKIPAFNISTSEPGSSKKRRRQSKYDIPPSLTLPDAKKIKEDVPPISFSSSGHTFPASSVVTSAVSLNTQVSLLKKRTSFEGVSSCLFGNIKKDQSKIDSDDKINCSSKTSDARDVTLLSRTYESKSQTVTNSSVTTSQIKPIPSLITVKTVPSFSIPQSRPVSSILNSTKASSSNLMTTSTTFKSSILPPSTSFSRPVSFVNESSTLSGSLYSETQPDSKQNYETDQQSDVKRGVTIKSVVQDKRCVSDDDIEIMKKVKFYKLEMRYLACQEQCKKLRIELAKALSKNRELQQSLEEKAVIQMNEAAESSEVNVKDPEISQLKGLDADKQELSLGETGTNTSKEMKDITKAPNETNSDNDKRSLNTEHVSDDIESTKKPMSDSKVFDLGRDDSNDNNNDGSEKISSASALQQDFMDVDEMNSLLSYDEASDVKKSQNPLIAVKAPDETNSLEADVYTMVRTSVLRNLQSDIEVLSKEKKELLKHLENYRNRQSINQ